MNDLIKKISPARVWAAVAVGLLTSVIPACFETLRNVSEQTLRMGFPIPFYAVRAAVYEGNAVFGVHFNIAGFIVNVLIYYLIITLIIAAYKKIKGDKQN